MREREVKGHEDKASLTVNSGRYAIMQGKNPSPLPLTMDRTLCPKIFPFPNYFDLNVKINLSKQKHLNLHQTVISFLHHITLLINK